jgi:hypothetical protein
MAVRKLAILVCSAIAVGIESSMVFKSFYVEPLAKSSNVKWSKLIKAPDKPVFFSRVPLFGH